MRLRYTNRILCVIWVLTTVLGCDSEERTTSETTPGTVAESLIHIAYEESDIVKLTGEEIGVSDSLASPRRVLKFGSHLLVQDNRTPRPFHLIDRIRKEYVQSFGQRGEGPGEFRQISSLMKERSAKDAGWVYDSRPKRLTYVDLNNLEVSLSNDAMIINLDTRTGTPLDVAWVSDSLFIGQGLFTEGRLAQYRSDGSFLQSIGDSPPGEEDVPIPVRQHAYHSRLDVHPEGTLIVVVTRHADQIEIFELDGVLTKVIKGPLDFVPIYETRYTGGYARMATGKDLRFGYIDVAVTATHFFALYSGRTREEYPGKANFANLIHKFTWDGELVQVFELDRDVLMITVDEEEKTLYGTQLYPIPEIVVYKF